MPKAHTQCLKSASIFQYNQCCYIFDFGFSAVQNFVSNHGCAPVNAEKQAKAF